MRDENILAYSTGLIMALKLHVPSIVCAGCGDTITQAIQTVEAEAKIDVDLKAKTVTVEAQASEESIKQAVVASGHTVLEA
jgi:copper chaperone